MGNEILMMVIQWTVTAALGAIAAFLGARSKARKKSDEEAKKREEPRDIGIRNLLRHDILQIHEKYMALGYCPVDIKEALEDSYNAYHALGGNGIITEARNDLLELPMTKPKHDD